MFVGSNHYDDYGRAQDAHYFTFTFCFLYLAVMLRIGSMLLVRQVKLTVLHVFSSLFHVRRGRMV